MDHSKRHQLIRAIIVSAIALIAVSSCDYFASDDARIEKARKLSREGEYRTAIIELKKVLQGSPDNKDARFLLGTISFASGDMAAAEKELRRASELGVPMDRVAHPLGQALLAQGEYEQLLEELDPRAVEQDEIKAAVLMLRGDAYLATGKRRDAESTFRQVLQLRPDSIDGRIGLAKAAQIDGDFDAAEKHLKGALSLGPNSVAAWLAKGQLEFQRKRYAQAEEAFSRAIDSGDPRANVVQEFIARNGLAEVQWRQGKSDEAIDNVQRAMRLAPAHPRPKYLRALIAYGAGDYETAVQQLQQILQLYPDYKPAQLLLGAAQFARGNLEQADMYLSSVLAADPSSLQARKLLAATRLREQKPEDALNTLHPAIARGANDQQLLALMSRASFQAGDTDSGILYLEQGLKSDPSDQAMQMDLAAGYLSAGELEQAIEILEKLPETKEGAYRREVLLVLAYLRKGDTANALAQGRKLLADHPNSAGVHNLVGSIHMVAGDTPKARQEFDKALQLQPENLAVLLNLGRLEYREGKQDAARQRFEHVLQLSPKNVNAMLALAQLSAIRGDQAQTRQWLERASASDPQAPGPRLLLVRHYLGQRDIDKARELAIQLAKDAPKNARVQDTLGIVQMGERNYAAAAESFRKATKLAPKSANFHYNLARAQLGLRNFGEAEHVLRKTVELDPNHVRANSALAVLEMRAGKTTQALARAQKLQKQDPKSPTGYILEGDLRMIERNFGSAINAYNTAMKYADNAFPAVRASQARRIARMPQPAKPLQDWVQLHPDDVRARLLLAQAYQAENQKKEAIQQYEWILQKQPNDAVVLNNLAWLYHEQNDARSLELAERAHKISPDSGGVTDTLGWLLVQKGELDRGLQLLREAAQQAPNVPDVRYHLAVALARSGAKEEARRTLMELVNSGKNFKEMAEAKRLLENL
jgi:putative PEP-CTERM system TPR-repeat lipoprotein